ncbi:hypothetical protein [Actinocorallia longicatena]|uniref:Uncharacterized protein n=1 Tax=Actinocorallia longicatena TaxID=111803 RepID=A0ABP6QJW8_9ACTN
MKAPLVRRGSAAALALAAGALAVAAPPQAALAAAPPISPALTFDDCPTAAQLPPDAVPDFWLCSVVVITGGRLQLGRIDQKITSPIRMTFANGFDPVTLEEKFIFTPLKGDPVRVDGGIFGIPGTDILPVLQVSAQPQFAADPVSSPPDAPSVAYRMKLKIKTINTLLGDGCFIGSAASPVTLNLTFLTTDPPPPNTPISGTPIEAHPDDPSVFTSRLVDNAFSVPKSEGCGPWGLFNPIADLRAGLPAKAGTNTAVFETQTRWRGYADPALTGTLKALRTLTPQQARAAIKAKAAQRRK